MYVMLRLDLSHLSSAQAKAAIATAIQNNVPLYTTQLLIGLACSVLGGYVAARLARREELLNGALSSFLCVALGVYMVASGNDSTPHWLQVLMFVASPASALFGGYLVQRSRQKYVNHLKPPLPAS
jgi:uncharacterized membrane protein YfcA